MHREEVKPRQGWRTKVEAQGLSWPVTDMPDGRVLPYWHEGARYEFSMTEIDRLEEATETLHQMCLDVVPDLASGRYGDLGLPDGALPLALASFEASPPSVYGRFDLAYDGIEIKMLEYNADTPTGLVETAVAQWSWLQDTPGEFDQWNSVWDRLVARWDVLVPQLPSRLLHLATAQGDGTGEEWMTVEVMAEMAKAAGLDVKTIFVDHIHYDKPSGKFVDPDDVIIEQCFALYPWENMLNETYGGLLMREARAAIAEGRDGDPMNANVVWIEPMWKVLLSSKMLAVALWDRFKDDPAKAQLLLPAYADGDVAKVDLVNWVSKPLHGREGDNIVIHAPEYGLEIQMPGDYGSEGHIWQEYVPLPVYRDLDGSENHLVLGSWVVDGKAAGVLCREADGPVTDYFSRVVPHIINDALSPTPEQVTAWLKE